MTPDETLEALAEEFTTNYPTMNNRPVHRPDVLQHAFKKGHASRDSEVDGLKAELSMLQAYQLYPEVEAAELIKLLQSQLASQAAKLEVAAEWNGKCRDKKNEIVKKAEKLASLMSEVNVKGPDDDGLIWLSIKAGTGKMAVSFEQERITGQTVKLFGELLSEALTTWRKP